MVNYGPAAPGDFNVGQNLTVTGNATVSGTSTLVGNVQCDNALSCTNDLSVGGSSTLVGLVTAQDQLHITAGVIDLGVDVNIYRDSANVLRTDDYFHMPNGQVDADFTFFAGDAKAVNIASAGGGLAVKEGANARMGRAVLTGATPVVIANTSVTAATEVFAFTQIPGGIPGHFWVSARTAGTSFSITGTAGDTSTVAWLLVEPA